jgi:hypothetical protein
MMGIEMSALEDIRAKALAGLRELEEKRAAVQRLQSTGTMYWRGNGVSGPPIDSKRSMLGHYERLIGEQRAILQHLDQMR